MIVCTRAFNSCADKLLSRYIYIYVCTRTRIWGWYVRYRAANGNVKLDYMLDARHWSVHRQRTTVKATWNTDTWCHFALCWTDFLQAFLCREKHASLVSLRLVDIKNVASRRGIYTREKQHVLKSSCMHRLNLSPLERICTNLAFLRCNFDLVQRRRRVDRGLVIIFVTL